MSKSAITGFIFPKLLVDTFEQQTLSNVCLIVLINKSTHIKFIRQMAIDCFQIHSSGGFEIFPLIWKSLLLCQSCLIFF